MLTIYVRMDILRADAEPLCKLRLQTAGIQNRAGAKNLMLRKAGDLVENVGQNIYGVGNDDIDRIRRGLNDLRCNFLENVNIALRQLQPGLAGLSGELAA